MIREIQVWKAEWGENEGVRRMGGNRWKGCGNQPVDAPNT